MNKFVIKDTKLNVSRLAMGCAKIGVCNDKNCAERLLDTFYDLGGNLYDTARVYGNSEEILGTWLRKNGKRENVIIVTKGGHPNINENLNYCSRFYRKIKKKIGIPVIPKVRNTREELRMDLEESLKNLQSDYIDVYLYHRDDPTMPVEQLVEIMEEFVHEGKIRYYGCSNWSTNRIREVDAYCKRKGYRGFVTNQALYNVGVHGMRRMIDPTMKKMDNKMIEYHKQQTENVAMGYSSICSGFFHKLDSNWNPNLEQSEYFSEENLRCLEELKKLMKKYGASLTQVELGFLLTRDFSCIPIYGPRNEVDLLDAVQALDIPFTVADYQFLERVN